MTPSTPTGFDPGAAPRGAAELYRRLQRFGYRGIAFNVLLAASAAVAAGALLPGARGIFQDGEPSLPVTVAVIAAFVAEPVLFYRRFHDVCAHRNAMGMASFSESRGAPILFGMLLFNATCAFFALMLAARSLGFADDQAAGVVGMVVTFRFLGMLFAGFEAMDARERLSARAALWTDVGVSTCTAVYYVCVWRVLTGQMAAASLPGSALAIAAETVGLLLMALLWLLPMRFVYFLEEWWGRPAGGTRAAVLSTAVMVIVEVALLQVGRPGI